MLFLILTLLTLTFLTFAASWLFIFPLLALLLWGYLDRKHFLGFFRFASQTTKAGAYELQALRNEIEANELEAHKTADSFLNELNETLWDSTELLENAKTHLADSKAKLAKAREENANARDLTDEIRETAEEEINSFSRDS
jgi:septal ring factor EnvC (AmiA/AmiB activator)